MSDPNEYLKNAISSYLSRVTDYALLVTGPWGSGKTYQVKTTLQKTHNQRLYMSVAGASSSGELSFRLVVAATPFLGTKFANVAEQILSGLLSRIKIEYKLKLSDFAKVPANAVIVIDDVERFDGKTQVLLAFANSLVEQGEKKVILLAAENELRDEQGDLFLKTKEKVVGQQLTVTPDPEGLIRGILYRIPQTYQTFLLDNSGDLELVFGKLARGNLRSLKRFIFDFLPVYKGLSEDGKLDAKAIVKVAQTLLAFTFPARRNDINRDLIDRRPENAYTAAFIERAGSGHDLYPLLEIGKAVPELDIYDQTIGNDLIKSFVFDGFVPSALVERTKNDLLIGAGGGDAKPWRVLWHYLDVDDEAFSKALSAFQDEFFKRRLVEPGEIIHAFGILFELSDAKLVPYDEHQIADMVQTYADEIVNNPQFDLTLGDDIITDSRHGGAYGLVFHQLDNPLMLSAIAHLREMAEEKRQANLIERFEKVFDAGGGGLNPSVAIEIMVGSDQSNSLHGVAFLQKVSAMKVAQRLSRMGAEDQGSIMRSIASRFSKEPADVRDKERLWVSDLVSALKDELEKIKSDLVRRRISQMIEWYLIPLVQAEAAPSE